MTRLAYLVSQYPTISHTFVLREIRGLREIGFEVVTASIRPPERPLAELTPIERDEAASTFYIARCGVQRFLAAHFATVCRRPGSYASGLAFALRLAGFDLRQAVLHLAYFAQAVVVGDWLRRQRLLHLHTHFSSTVALFVGRVFPVTVSSTIHGSDEFIDPAGFHMLEKCRDSLFIRAISNFGRSQLMRFSDPSDWDKYEVCPLGVDPVAFEPGLFRANPECFEILTVGRLAPVKAIPVLLAAVGALVAEGRALRLRIAGGGALCDALKIEVAQRGLASHVSLEGPLNQEQIKRFYREANAFVLASFAEGVPVVLMEAMAMEIPCVATWVTGVPELIRNEIDGLLVGPADTEALTVALARLMDDVDLRRRLGHSASQRIRERYNLKTNIDSLAAIFTRRLDRNVLK